MSIRKRQAEAIIGALMADLAAAGEFDVLAIVKQAAPPADAPAQGGPAASGLTPEQLAKLKNSLAIIKDVIPFWSGAAERSAARFLEAAINANTPAIGRLVSALDEAIGKNEGNYSSVDLQRAKDAIADMRSIYATPTATDTAKQSVAVPGATRLGPTRSYVLALQTALKQRGADLGKTGRAKDGVDGIYGNKTRQAVKDFAAANGIEIPLDSSGRPTEVVNQALGISAPDALPSQPLPVAKTPSAGKQEEADKSVPQAGGKRPLWQFKLLDGTEFNMLNFSRGLPKGGLTMDNEPWEATQALAQIRYALAGGGIKLQAQLPQIKMLGISTIEQYRSYMASIDAVVAEIQQKCDLIARSFLAEVNKKRKELGMKEVARPSPHENPEEVYEFEESFWLGALAGGSIAQSAQKILSEKLLSFFRGSKKKIFDLLKATADVNPIFKGNSLNEDSAKKIGEAIANTSTEFAKQIDEQDSSFYYDFNKDPPSLRHSVNKSLVAIGESSIRQMLTEE